MKAKATLRVVLVDPSLFTAPYDAALTEGLVEAGVEPTWAVRPTRPGDRQELAPEHVDDFFYRRVDRLAGWPRPLRSTLKGLAHAIGLATLVRRVFAQAPDVVHFQWAVVPALDVLALFILRRRCPIVLTVHDTVPFNGEHLSLWQNLAFDLPSRLCDRVIVHTRAGRDTLVRRGVPASKVTIIPHGPLKLSHAVPAVRAKAADESLEARQTFVMFGELKPYKGVDVLVEAVALLPPAVRDQARFVIAGRPRMDLQPLRTRIVDLGLSSVIELRARRLTEVEMAELFARTDCFVFPYRQVDASGVYFLVQSLSRWIIASRVGVFAEDLEDGVHGTLVDPSDPRALASAIALAVARRGAPPTRPSTAEAWTAIGRATHDVYVQTMASRPRAARVRDPIEAAREREIART